MKQELIDRFHKLLENEDVKEIKSMAFELIDAFQEAKQNAISSQKEAFVAEGGDPHYFEPSKDPLDSKFLEVENLFRDRYNEYLEEQKKNLADNYLTKKNLIEELKDVIENEENIGRAFNRFNAVKKKWDETGRVEKKFAEELRVEYSNLIERFYYHISIYKELKENDLKKNGELKRDVIKRINALKDEPSIKECQVLLDAYLVEWDRLGPCLQAEWPEIKESFHEAVGEIRHKIGEHYKQLRDNQKENIEKKEALVAKLKEATETLPSQHNHWKKVTETVHQIQDEFKKIGPGQRAKNQRVWEDFKSLLDRFYDAKKGFYKEKKAEFKEVKSDKKDIIQKAEQLLPAKDVNPDRIDWKGLTGQFIRLQKEWKKAGTLIHAEERKMWKIFRSRCDEFFNRKKAYFESLKEREKENLVKKQQIIEKLEAFSPGKDQQKDKENVEGLLKSYQEIGPVPYKDKKNLNRLFNKASKAAFKKINLDKEQLNETMFSNKLELIKQEDPSPIKALQNELRNIDKRIKSLEDEKLQVENNLGFFKHTPDDNPLKKEVLQKVARIEKTIQEWRDKRKATSKTIRDEKQKEKAAQAPKEAPAEESDKSNADGSN